MIFFSFIKESIIKWWMSDPFSLGAALAFYTIFALTPLLILIISFTGIAFGPSAVEGTLVKQIQGEVGSRAAEFISALIVQTQHLNIGTTANVIGLLALIIGAIGLFSQLQLSLNKIWNVPPKKTISVFSFIEQKVSAFVMVIILGFLFVVSFILNAFSNIFTSILDNRIPHIRFILGNANFLFSFLLVVGMFLFIYKYLPNVHISWEGAFLGSLTTGVLFIIGKIIIALYLTIAPVNSSYGAAGALIIILLWVYYSSQIFFLGAACTYVIEKRINAKNVLL
jgi:membrane protein